MKVGSLPLNALRAFAAVYATGGIRSAARLLSISHSSISRYIQLLEATVGVKLIVRNSSINRITFSDAGEALGRRASKCFQDLGLAVDTIGEVHPQNSVLVATTPSFGKLWLLPRLKHFRAIYPWIEVSIFADSSLTDPAAEQESDVSIRSGGGKSFDGYEPLMSETLIPVASPEYARSLGAIFDMSSLKSANLLHDRNPQASWGLWASEFKLDFLDTRKGQRFSSPDLLLSAASAGLGVALGQERLALPSIQDGSLERLFKPHSIILHASYWVMKKRDASSRIAVRLFTEWLQEEAKQTFSLSS